MLLRLFSFIFFHSKFKGFKSSRGISKTRYASTKNRTFLSSASATPEKIDIFSEFDPRVSRRENSVSKWENGGHQEFGDSDLEDVDERGGKHVEDLACYSISQDESKGNFLGEKTPKIDFAVLRSSKILTKKCSHIFRSKKCFFLQLPKISYLFVRKSLNPDAFDAPK